MLNLAKTILHKGGSLVSRVAMGTTNKVGGLADVGGKNFILVLKTRSSDMFDYHTPCSNDMVPCLEAPGGDKFVKESPLGHCRPITSSLTLDLEKSITKKILEVGGVW